MKGFKVSVIVLTLLYTNIIAISLPWKKSSTSKTTVSTSSTTKPSTSSSTWSKFKSKLPSSPFKKSSTTTTQSSGVSSPKSTSTSTSMFQKFKSKLPSSPFKQTTTASSTQSSSEKSGQQQSWGQKFRSVATSAQQKLQSAQAGMQSVASGVQQAAGTISGIAQTGKQLAAIFAPRKFGQQATQGPQQQAQLQPGTPDQQPGYAPTPVPQASPQVQSQQLPSLEEVKPQVDPNLINQLVQVAQSLFPKTKTLLNSVNLLESKITTLQGIAKSKHESSILLNLQTISSNLNLAEQIINSAKTSVESGYKDLGSQLANEAKIKFDTAEVKVKQGEGIVMSSQNTLNQLEVLLKEKEAKTDLKPLEQIEGKLQEGAVKDVVLDSKEKPAIQEKVLTPKELEREIDLVFEKIQKKIDDEKVPDEQLQKIVDELIILLDDISAKIERTKSKVRPEEITKKIDDSYEQIILFKSMQESPLYNKKPLMFIKWLKEEIAEEKAEEEVLSRFQQEIQEKAKKISESRKEKGLDEQGSGKVFEAVGTSKSLGCIDI